MTPAQRRSLRTGLVVLACVAVLALWWWANQDPAESAGGQARPSQSQSQPNARTPGQSPDQTQGATGQPPSTPGQSGTDGGVAPRSQTQQPDRQVLRTINASQLPPEGRQTLQLIRDGGPFRYERDGVTFQNREGILPSQKRGYYREYTVPTPGEEDRGARRIVTGDRGERYYTDDHYDSFRVIREGA